MTKMIHLIQNELTKQLKKVSVIIMLCLLLAASIALPVFKLVVDTFENDAWNLRYIDEDIQRMEQEKENAPKDFTDDQKKMLNEAVDIQVQYLNMQKENNIRWDDWRYDELYTLNNLHNTAFIQKQLIAGISSSDISVAVSMAFYPEDILAQNSGLSKEELQKSYEENMKQVSTKYQAILKNDYIGHLKNDVRPEAVQAVKALESGAQSSQEQEGSTVMNNGAIAQYGDQGPSSKVELEQAKMFLEIVDYRIEHNVMYDRSDWRHNTLLAMNNEVENANATVMSKEDFEATGNTLSYDAYKKMAQDSIQKAKDEITRCRYSLNNNIPIMEHNGGSRYVLSIGLIFIMGIMVICIMVGGSIMSQEYSKGTVRLLMLRPVARWKIILSKFICVLLIGLGAMVATGVVQTITSAFLFGFGDLLAPVLVCSGGVVTEVPFFLWYLLAGLYAGINVLFASCLAVALSTIFKNTAFAVGLSIFITLSGFFVVMVGANLGMYWLAYTFFPYFNLGTYVTGGQIQQLYQMLNFPTYPVYGACLLAALAVLLTVVTTIIFQKRDVKN